MPTKTAPKPKEKKPPPPKKKPTAGKPPKKPSKAAAKKPKEQRYDTPDVLAKYDAATVVAMGEKLKELKEAQTAFHLAKERAANLKKGYEACRAEYEELYDERKKWRGQKPPGVQKEIPFERQASPAVDGTPTTEPAGAVPNPEGPGWYPADLWRSFPLDRWTLFGATPTDLQKLREGKHKKGTAATPITTVGELSDFSRPFASDPTRNMTYGDIKGIGPEGATRISDAELRFWGEWKTKGLAESYAKEKGHAPPPTSEIDGRKTDADDATKPASGKRTAGAAGSNGQGGKRGSAAAKPKAKKPKPKPAEPKADPGEPATIPFDPAAGGAERDPEEARTGTA